LRTLGSRTKIALRNLSLSPELLRNLPPLLTQPPIPYFHVYPQAYLGLLPFPSAPPHPATVPQATAQVSKTLSEDRGARLAGLKHPALDPAVITRPERFVLLVEDVRFAVHYTVVEEGQVLIADGRIRHQVLIATTDGMWKDNNGTEIPICEAVGPLEGSTEALDKLSNDQLRALMSSMLKSDGDIDRNMDGANLMTMMQHDSMIELISEFASVKAPPS